MTRRLALACAAIVALGLGACDRSADHDPAVPAVPASTGAAGGRGATGPQGARAPAETSVIADAGSSQLSDSDRSFIASAAVRGLFAMQASQLAAARASGSEVRSLAAMLINDHTNAGNELAQLAAARGVPLPTRLPPELQAQLRRLSQGSGPSFDRDYVQQVGITEHQKDIRSFEEASSSTRDQPLKDWIGKTLPALRQHLSEAQKLTQRG